MKKAIKFIQGINKRAEEALREYFTGKKLSVSGKRRNAPHRIAVISGILLQTFHKQKYLVLLIKNSPFDGMRRIFIPLTDFLEEISQDAKAMIGATIPNEEINIEFWYKGDHAPSPATTIPLET